MSTAAKRADFTNPDRNLFTGITTSPETAANAAKFVSTLTGIECNIATNASGTGYILTSSTSEHQTDEACKLVYDAIAEHTTSSHEEIHIKPTAKYSFPIALSAQVTDQLANQSLSPNAILAYKIKNFITRSTGRGDIRVTPSEPDAGFIIQRRYNSAPGLGTSMDVVDVKLVAKHLNRAIADMPGYDAKKTYVYLRPGEQGDTFPIQVSQATGQYLASLPPVLGKGHSR